MEQQKDPDPTKGKSLVDLDSLSIKNIYIPDAPSGPCREYDYVLHLCKQIKPFM